MKIGNINFNNKPIILAPMEDVTDSSFRNMCKYYGADLLYTEFVSGDALIRKINKNLKKIIISDSERPISIQIYGKDPDIMAEAAKIVETFNPDFIDINFGCPVRKIATKGAGAGLLQNIPLLLKITESVVKAVKIPVTVKTRLGWDEDNKPIVELSEKLQDTGIKALTIHGRTRAQMYSGEADWTLIREIKENKRMYIPIIGNGDIDSPLKAKKAFDDYGVDGIMIGRASIGNPYIFKEIKYYLENNTFLPPLTIKEQVDELIKYLDLSVKNNGELNGVTHLRRHFAKSFKGLNNFRETRIKLLTTKSYCEVIEILNSISNNWE